MKICLITDLHINMQGELPLGIDTQANLIKVLHHIGSKKYEFIMINGDLMHFDTADSSYQWIGNKMKSLKTPIYVTAGNHDDPVILAHAFDMAAELKGSELYYIIQDSGFSFICLDTSKGKMSEQQWMWLEDQIEHRGQMVYIFMHHPPIISYSKHMEPKYIFLEVDRFERLCSKYAEKQFHIFCGHYHIERTIIKNNIQVYITPSTFVQIDPDEVQFKILDTSIGYRDI
ncbi:MAG: metallophosphoesterase, partial [Saprospiraceae bacterium]